MNKTCEKLWYKDFRHIVLKMFCKYVLRNNFTLTNQIINHKRSHNFIKLEFYTDAIDVK